MGGREKIGEAKVHCAFAKAKALNPRPPVAVLSFPATSSLAPRSSERAFNSLLRPGLGLAGGDSAGTATLHLVTFGIHTGVTRRRQGVQCARVRAA